MICRVDIKCAALNPSGVAGVPACDSVQTSPAQAASDPCKALNFADVAGEHQEVPVSLSGPMIDIPCQARKARLAHLTQGRRAHGTCSSPTCASLWGSHGKYWLAILHKDKWVEFHSSKQPMLLEAGQCLLFALAMRRRRNGQGSLVLARVREVGLLDVDRAREAFPRESDDCNLADLAAK